MTKGFIKNFIGLALLTNAMTHAATTTTNVTETKVQKKLCLSEACISTPALQKEVERLSIEGKMPFEMGLELMKRWSNNKIS